MRPIPALVIHAVLAVSFAAPVSAQAPVFVLKWGGFGSAAGQFNAPYCVDVDATGAVYVTDQGNHRVQKFTSDGSFVTSFGGFGTAPGQFNVPSGVAVDASGFVYVTDRGNLRVQKFTSTGTFVTSWGGNGQASGQFRMPLGIAVGPDGTILVADGSNHRIQRFTSEGVFLNKWGNTSGYNLSVPEGIACDDAGFVYVTDHGIGNTVQKFSLTGDIILGFGGTGTTPGMFDGPVGLDVDQSGRVFVSDSRNQRVQILTSIGAPLAQFGAAGTGNGQFNKPCDVAVGPSGEIYVVDLLNHRIQKFAEPAVNATSTTWGRLKDSYR